MTSVRSIFIVFSLILWNQCSSHLVSRDIGTDDESIVEELKMAKQFDDDDLNLLQFSMFGKPYSFKLAPANSIFSPNFKIMQSGRQIDYQIDLQTLKESEPLEGSFYTDENGRGSFYIQHKNGEIQLNGFVDDTFVINHSQGRHTALKIQHKKTQIDRILDFKTPSFKPSFGKNKLQHEVATVEVLVFIDPTVHKNLVDRKANIKTYMGIFWNDVQNKYKIFSNPKIQFSLSGVIAIGDMGWMGDIFLAPNEPNDDKFVESFAFWAYKQKQQKKDLPKFDVAVLHTGLDLSYVDKGEITTATLGVAPVGQICVEMPQEKATASICVFEDFNAPTFSGAMTAVHEIGHLLGADHDSESDCDNDAIMLPILQPISPSIKLFCNSSIEKIRTLLSSDGASCLFDSPQPHLPLGPEESTMTRDAICKMAYGADFYAMSLDMYSPVAKPCVFVLCERNDPKKVEALMWVPEGTPCGDDEKVCIKGECIAH